jgi:hypothetical protein
MGWRISLLGNHSVVYFGSRREKFLRYWAKDGQIHMEDARDNSYEALSTREFLQIISAISDMLGNSRSELKEAGVMHLDEFDRCLRFVEEGFNLAQIAKEQGDPYSPDARRDRKRRRATSVRIVQPAHF